MRIRAYLCAMIRKNHYMQNFSTTLFHTYTFQTSKYLHHENDSHWCGGRCNRRCTGDIYSKANQQNANHYCVMWQG